MSRDPGKHRMYEKSGSNGMMGWTWASEKYKGGWVNEHIHVERGGTVLLEAKTAKPFVEEWGFVPQGIVAKSRALHGPAKVELFSLDGRGLLASVDAFADDLPAWARPYSE